MSSRDCRHVSSSASAKGAEMQFLALGGFPSFPFWLQFYPLHVNSLPGICTSRFPVYWEHHRPQLGRSGGYGEIQICTWIFLKCITEICFFSFSKCLWRYLHFTFFFFYMIRKVILYLCARVWMLRRTPGQSTRMLHGAGSWSISGGWRIKHLKFGMKIKVS